MKRIVLTAAAALMMGTAAYADGHAAMTYEMEASNDFYASNLIGMRVYATESDYANSMVTVGAAAEWDDIGEIDDLIISPTGDVEAVIVGVGGFLGIGERDVALTMDAIKVLTEEGGTGERFLVVNYTAEQLEAAPAFERDMSTGVDSVRAGTDTAAVAPRQANRPMLTAPSVERDGYTAIERDTPLTAEELTGAYVYGVNDETVGEIGELLLTDDGKIDRAVINVGGFLGLGEKPVAVTMDELTLMRADDGDLRVYIDSNQEALEAQPEYEG